MTILATALSGIFFIVFGILLIMYKKLNITPFVEEDIPSTDHAITEVPIITPQMPQNTHQKPVTPPTATLDTMCIAIRDFEGKPGDRNYRNCNPGNAKYSKVGYAKMYGEVKKDSGGFAIFKDMETGMLYLHNLIKVKIKRNPDQTLLDFMNVYAPPSDNNPTVKYAKFVAKRLGVDINFRMGDLIV